MRPDPYLSFSCYLLLATHSAMSPHDATLGWVVRGHLDLDLVSGNDPDPSATPHLSRCSSNDLEAGVELDPELRVPQCLDDRPLSAKGVVASCHRGCYLRGLASLTVRARPSIS